MKHRKEINVAVIGSGTEGGRVISALMDCPSVNIAGICSIDPSSISELASQQLSVPLCESVNELRSAGDIDIVVNTTTENVEGLDSLKDVEIIQGKASEIIKAISNAYKSHTERLGIIIEAGLELPNKKTSKDIYRSVVENALRVTGCAAGSLVVFDEKTEMCWLAEAIGYPHKFADNRHWELQPNGTTENLLDCKYPVFIPDIKNEDGFDNPAMNEGTVSVLATALREDDDVIGMLYVGDFSSHTFTEQEISLFSAFSGQASLALQKALLLEKNEELTVIDRLSGLYNSRHFFDTLDTEVKRIQRYGGNFSVLGMDIDNLGYINNQFGHEKGDWVVKKVAEIIVECARQTDYKARYGGDEFALILPSTSYQQASILGNRIRREVNEITIEGAEELVSLSVSIGIAEFPHLGPDSTNLLTAVNTALTVCKQRGRNLVCCYEQTSE